MCEHSVMRAYMNRLAPSWGKSHFWIITRKSLIHKTIELSKRIIRNISMEKSHETHSTHHNFLITRITLFPYTYLTLHHHISEITPSNSC
jgi:hypothetical protein